MKLSESIKPVTYLKTNSADVIKKVTDSKRPMIVTQNGEAKVVVMDIETYERDRQAFLMMRILAKGVRDAENGKLHDADEVFDEVEEMIRKAVNEKKI